MAYQIQAAVVTAVASKDKAKFQAWCKEGGLPGSGIFYVDYALFGGTVHKHIF